MHNSGSTTTESLSRHLNSVLDAALARERVVGAVVLVSLDGEVVFEGAVGHADREAGRKMRTDTIFRFASMTKAIVCAAAMSALDDGSISLDEPIVTWLPAFRPRLANGEVATLTVRHLLTHTGGLDYGFDSTRPNYRELGVSNGLEQPGLSMTEAMRKLAAAPLVYEPGTAWIYSLGIDVLGAVLEQAIGKGLDEIVKDRVTGPLSLADTDFRVVDRDRLAQAYMDGMPRPIVMPDPAEVPNSIGSLVFSPSRIFDETSYFSGGAGMAGTARDYWRFLEALRLGGKPMMRQATHRAFTMPQLPNGISIGIAGWNHGFVGPVLANSKIARTPHETGTYRGGGAYGHQWFVDPKRRLTFVMFSNTAFEGVEGATPLSLVDATYYAISSANR